MANPARTQTDRQIKVKGVWLLCANLSFLASLACLFNSYYIREKVARTVSHDDSFYLYLSILVVHGIGSGFFVLPTNGYKIIAFFQELNLLKNHWLTNFKAFLEVFLLFCIGMFYRTVGSDIDYLMIMSAFFLSAWSRPILTTHFTTFFAGLGVCLGFTEPSNHEDFKHSIIGTLSILYVVKNQFDEKEIVREPEIEDNIDSSRPSLVLLQVLLLEGGSCED